MLRARWRVCSVGIGWSRQAIAWEMEYVELQLDGLDYAQKFSTPFLVWGMKNRDWKVGQSLTVRTNLSTIFPSFPFCI